MRIYAVVVTFNRLNLLKQVIQSIESQTVPVYSIIIINNNSTDGTEDWLKKKENISFITQENSGGAGGFHSGIKYAYENGADWIWVMDDDVFPQNDALEELLKYSDISDCLVPKRIFSDNVPVNWGGIFDIKRRTLILGTRPQDQSSEKPYNYVNTCCFEGLLISKKIVSQIGFPDSRFFISGDDTVYGLMASRITNVLLINSAILIRAKSSNEASIMSPFYLYYYFRNFHLFEEYYKVMYKKKGFGLETKLRYIYEVVQCLFRSSRGPYSVLKMHKAILKGVFGSFFKKVGK